ncbi:MAG TPA: hypothetical protein EYQ43_10435 [Methyloprofundus sp.]|uniref:hypothetical protein n=1 Tax=Methyloprofundus sp. TaxID=2020875 RepID=UPI0017E4328F|nr:hypothetical protein [Methyloprofundus sp.]HIG65943.1 hypothetical protein [Methyloprofundus sp.]
MFTLRYFRPKFVFFVGFIIIPAIIMVSPDRRFFQKLVYILFPRFWKQEVESPLFILDNSSPTFLHRMLEKDQQYTYLSLWQSLFNSMTLYKFVGIIGALGKKLALQLHR